MYDAVDNPAVIVYENQVGMPAHELADQPSGHVISQLVHAVEINFDDSVALHLSDIRHAGTKQHLPHQHAERRRLQGIILFLIGQVNPGAAGVSRCKQHSVLSLIANGQNNFIFFRLSQLINPSADQLFFQFTGYKSQHNAINWHGFFLQYFSFPARKTT